ncbi:MAG: serine hydrolase domain-containing protein, partial [Anaerolineales bacterium]
MDKMLKNHWMPILLVFTLITGCTAGSRAKPTNLLPEAEYWPTAAWHSTTPEEQGIDSDLLAQLFETIEDEDIRLHSLLILRNGYLVAEAYWHPYGPDDKHTIESNTKSIIGSLVGIAIEQGSLTGVEQKMANFFPERTIQNLDEQ